MEDKVREQIDRIRAVINTNIERFTALIDQVKELRADIERVSEEGNQEQNERMKSLLARKGEMDKTILALVEQNKVLFEIYTTLRNTLA